MAISKVKLPDNSTEELHDSRIHGVKIFYGTCSTAAATGEKAVVCPAFTSDDLGNGTILFVSFTYNNTAEPADVKLNVNSTGAFQVRKVYNYASSNLSNAGEIRGIVHQFICWTSNEEQNDYRWYLVGVDFNTNTTYSNMTQTNIDAGTSTTGMRISPKLLRDNFYTEDEVDSLVSSATEIPTLYFGDTNNPLTTEQKAHNLEVLQDLCETTNSWGINTPYKVVNFSTSSGMMVNFKALVCSTVYASGDTTMYGVYATLSLGLFSLDHYDILFTTGDGDLATTMLSNIEQRFLCYKGNISTLTLGNEGVETTSTNTNFEPYSVSLIDIEGLQYKYKYNLSYDYSIDTTNGYYQLYFDTADKKIRVRVYSDHITTLWTSRDASGGISDVTVGGTSVVSNGVAEITLPTVPTISTNIQTDKASDTKTSSPKSVYDEVHPNVVSSQPQGGFTPNIFYNLSTISGNVTFALATPTDANIVNHYYWTFDTSSTAPTITWPSGISWYGGSAPTISASKHYEISIINNVAVCMEV